MEIFPHTIILDLKFYIQLISLEIPYFYTQIDMEGIARLGQSQPYFYLIFKRKYYLTFISTARL